MSLESASFMNNTSFIPDEIEKKQSNEKLANLIAFVLSIFSGATNTSVAILAERIGDKWLWAT